MTTTPRLLIIDDDDDFAGSLALALDLEGYPVDVASNGHDGIAAVKDTAYAAVLIDIGLPGLNGVEALSQIRQLNPQACCFLLTGYSADHLVEQGIDAGAVEILRKPIDVDRFLGTLAAALVNQAGPRGN